MQKLQHSGVPPNQIIQITGHKNLQSVNNYSSLWEKQVESISRNLSSTTKAATNVAIAQTENNMTAQPLAEYRIASTSTTSSTLDVNSFNKNRLQTMFHENYVTGGVFNINLAPAKNEVKSPDVDPKHYQIVAKNPQHHAILRYAFAVVEFFSSSLQFWLFGTDKYYCLYFSFITLYPSYVTFLWQTFCDGWPF